MKVTIEGTPEQVADVMKRPRRKRLSTIRYEYAVQRRSLLRAAFDLIRHDPSKKATVNVLAGTLGGRFPISQATLDLAQRIIDGMDINDSVDSAGL